MCFGYSGELFVKLPVVEGHSVCLTLLTSKPREEGGTFVVDFYVDFGMFCHIDTI